MLLVVMEFSEIGSGRTSRCHRFVPRRFSRWFVIDAGEAGE
jgi:hypothetical protein